MVVPLVYRITTPSTVQVSANWKFRRFSDFPVQWENRSCSEAVTSWILPSSRCLLFSTFDVWVISNTRLPALLDGSRVRIKRRNRFLGSPRRGSGEPGAQRRRTTRDLSVSANPLLEQRSRAVQGIFISDYALLQWLHWSRRPFKWLRSRGRLNRLHRAAEPPNWSHPSQHQTSWPVKISETGGCCVGSRRRREVGEAPSLGLWSPPPPTTAVTQFSWWGQTIRCDAYHYSRQPF